MIFDRINQYEDLSRVLSTSFSLQPVPLSIQIIPDETIIEISEFYYANLYSDGNVPFQEKERRDMLHKLALDAFNEYLVKWKIIKYKTEKISLERQSQISTVECGRVLEHCRKVLLE